MTTLDILLSSIGGLVLAYVILGNLWHRVIAPLPAPDPDTYPRAGDRIVSGTEGVVQEVIDVVDGRAIVRSTISPGAEGPPRHVHDGIEETFSPIRGTMRMEVNGRTFDLHPGESATVPPGVPHRFSNPFAEPVVLQSPAPDLSVEFWAMLQQVYRVMDERGSKPLTMMLQMSVIDPRFNTHLADVPRAAATIMNLVLAPMARLLGYRNYYPQYSLHPRG